MCVGTVGTVGIVGTVGTLGAVGTVETVGTAGGRSVPEIRLPPVRCFSFNRPNIVAAAICRHLYGATNLVIDLFTCLIKKFEEIEKCF